MAVARGGTRVFEEWVERDLTAAAEVGELPPAFEVDEPLTLASDVLSSGRNLLVAGEPGVGKSTLVYELVRRAAQGAGPAALHGRRILQFSFRHRVATLKEPRMLMPEMQRLVDALCRSRGAVVPFFRDFHLAYTFDLEAQLQTLAYRLTGPVLCEAEPALLSALMESWPELEQQYVTLLLEEPDLARSERILAAWAAHHGARSGQHFAAGALDEALHLTHRFLSRSRLPRKALDLLVQTASITGGTREVTGADVIDRFSRTHHVPRGLVDPSDALDVAALRQRVAGELLGQPDAVDAVCRMIVLIKSGMSDMRRPFGVFLFAGPTGVGKTHAVQLLAEQLFGRRDRLIRLNMADFQAPNAPEILFGDPGEFKPSLRRGLLTLRLAGQPFAVVLLDEFEKAQEKVSDRFLQLFDEGAFINGAGETIACRSMVLIVTSNLGAELYRDQPAGFFPGPETRRLRQEIERRLVQRFRLELLNRFDQVVHFEPLSRADVRTIAARELQSLRARIGLARSGLDLDVDESVLDWLAVHGYDPLFGARFLRRTLEREITSALAGLLVQGRPAPGALARLTVRRDRIEARLVPPDPPARRRRAPVVLPAGAGTETRTLDRDALAALGRDTLRAAEGPLAALETKRGEVSRLLDTMNAPGFWDRGGATRDVLDQYRRLDVAVQVEERFARALGRLDARLREGEPGDTAPFARTVEAAARALREWQDRLADEGPTEAWLLIERADPFRPAGAWLSDLARMELAWCARRHLQASVVACEIADGDLSRLALHVEGPGARASLAAEGGLHVRDQKAGPDLKARITLVDRQPGGDTAGDAVTATRRREGPLGLAISCATRLEMAASGMTIELLGSDARTIADLRHDLEVHYRQRGGQDGSDLARTYGRDGVGARDPRTGATVMRLKDALKGELDPLFDAWRNRAGAELAAT